MTKSCYILLGSNIEPTKNIKRAIEELRKYFEVTAISKVYESHPVVKQDVKNYLNAVVEVQCNLNPHTIKYDYLRKIERDMGRVRTEDKFKPRKIDLDLILWGNEVYDDGDIIIPDPEIVQYGHVAVPLADVAGNKIHPLLKIPISDIAARFKEESQLQVVSI